MPIYDFKCASCGHVFEKIVPSSVANVPCAQCGHETEKQVAAPAGFDLRGGGYYQTDFKNR